jgi:uncharacterized protein involved in exopolysaccharide biosynthesis
MGLPPRAGLFVRCVRDGGPRPGQDIERDGPPAAHSSEQRRDATLGVNMVRLLETFFRHRLLLLGPVVLVLVGATGWVFIQPPTYDSSVRVWVERQTLVPDPNSNPYLTPAQEQAGVLTELISTKYFDAKVGRRSPLADALRAASAHGTGGIRTRLLRLVGLAGPAGQLTESQVDDQVYNTIVGSTLVVPSGPEIITVTFRAGDPQMAALVAQAVVNQFMDETLTNQRVQADAAVAFYTSQVKQSQSDLAVADKAVDDYLLANPSQRSVNAIPDARMLQLRRDDDAAHQRQQSVLDKLDSARLNRVALDQSGTAGVRVLDKAETPTQASSVKKVVIQAVGVGAVLAVLILVVGVLLLTWLDSTIRRPQEVETILDLRPVGSVPRVS